MYDSDGNRLDDETVLSRYGGLSLRMARLDDAAHKIHKEQVHLPYPPLVFISYRRSGEERERLVDHISRVRFEDLPTIYYDTVDGVSFAGS